MFSDVIPVVWGIQINIYERLRVVEILTRSSWSTETTATTTGRSENTTFCNRRNSHIELFSTTNRCNVSLAFLYWHPIVHELEIQT